MGNQKQKWTQEEEEALLAGVAKHGPGKWKNILKDPEFAPDLVHRSNIDLKDKWRNLSVSSAQQGSKAKSTLNKFKELADRKFAPPPAVSPSPANVQNPPPADQSADVLVDDSSNGLTDGKSGTRYNAMILEAILAMKDANGCDISAIVNYIGDKHRLEVTPNFRKSVTSRLRRLHSQGKLEKDEKHRYRICKDGSPGTRPLSPKRKEVKARLPPSSKLTSAETPEEAAIAAAYKIAEAENKAHVAAEAVKEAERISKMEEDAESMLKIVIDVYEQCLRGEIVLMA